MAWRHRCVIDPATIHDSAVPEGAADRVAIKSLIEVMYSLDSDLEAGGWDRPPSYGFLCLTGRALTDEGHEASTFELHNVKTFPTVFADASRMGWRPAEILRQIAEVTRGNRVTPPPTVAALVFACEGWALRGSTDPVVNAEHVATCEKRRISDHPDRIETRMVHMAGVDGRGYALTHERGGVARHMTGDLDGEIPPALRYSMAIVCERDVAPWETWRENHDHIDPCYG